jgi:type 1 glutamine amidotransferase
MTRVLVLCDSRWHPESVVRQGTAAIAGPDLAFDYSNGGGPGALGALGSYPVVILSKSNQLSETDHGPWLDEDKAALIAAYVEGGGGLLVVHSGTCYRGSAAMGALIGGVFLSHPEQGSVEFSIGAGHPVTAGVRSFEAVDEHYQIEMLDPSALVLATSSAGGIEQPACWVAERGAGRLCAITSGHNLDVWLKPDFMRLLANALDWCSRGRLTR